MTLLRSFRIEAFKSLASLDLELGRVTVLIGENGCGKSNILEALAFTAAASADKLDHEFLAARGIRTTDARFMLSAFDASPPAQVTIEMRADDKPPTTFDLAYGPSRRGDRWRDTNRLAVFRMMRRAEAEVVARAPDHAELAEFRRIAPSEYAIAVEQFVEELEDFLIFAPENTALRTFQAEGQVLPLGIRGEGLFALLKSLRSTGEGRAALAQIAEQLTLLDWFREIQLDADLAPGERTLRIGDRYLAESALFDQRSANEGFLLLLFYFTLCISPGTPRFFAIDNVDASLNPRLCEELMRRLVMLAKRHNKQIVVTTHNASMLDGLDLADDEQRLLVVHRNRRGHTKVRRIENPTPAPGSPPVRLSEAFVRGYLGGLPKSF